MNKTQEIVLPSGKFATIRHPSYADVAISFDHNPIVHMWNLAALLALIDGEPITLDEFEELDLSDCMLIAEMISKLIGKATTAKGVA